MAGDDWAFVHGSRTSGTTVRHLLRGHLSPHTNGMGAVWPEKRGHMPAWYLAQLVDWENVKSFGITRHPCDRAVSLWGYCARQFGRLQWGENFRDWVRAGMPHQWGALPLPLFPGQPFGLPVTAPQVAWYYPWKIGGWWQTSEPRLVKVLYRFEDGVEENARQIWQWVAPHKPFPGIEHANKTEREKDWRIYYDRPTVERVLVLYREDFDTLGYDRPEL